MMNIVFIGDFRWNSGSSHVVYNYCRVAQAFDCDVRISGQYGSLDSSIPNFIPVCHDVRWADHLILVFESNQYLTEQHIEDILKVFSPAQITIIDPDGRYGPTVKCLGDSNHVQYSRLSWKNLYDTLSARILQPRLAELPDGVTFFPYFGMEYASSVGSNAKCYTIQYVGNNWYRWDAVTQFLSRLRDIRPQLGRIALKGKWWDGTCKTGLKKETMADVDLLKASDIETEYSVPFGSVIGAMGDAWISPIFVRPMIAAAMLLTPRMFETLCAHTIPIWSTEIQYISRVYGEEAHPFYYSDEPDVKIIEILADRYAYLQLSSDIRRRLFDTYNYTTLFAELLRLLTN
jgi:hypothetical protein